MRAAHWHLTIRWLRSVSLCSALSKSDKVVNLRCEEVFEIQLIRRYSIFTGLNFSLINWHLSNLCRIGLNF